MKSRIINDNLAKRYTMDDAYVIVGRGVGRLDLEKASNSEAFAEKAKQLATLIDKVNVVEATPISSSRNNS